MTVWAICAVKDEADIFGDTLAHMLAQGVEGVVISDGMSTDGTRDIIERAGYDGGLIVSIDDPDPIFRQAATMNRLAGMAADRGATWIVPFDADEYWSSCDGTPIASTLCSLDASVVVAYAQMFEYVDHVRRLPDPKPLPKVAYRWNPLARLTMGQHSVEGVHGYGRPGVLVCREIQFRNREHYKKKVRARLATLEPGLPPGAAQHYRELEGLTDAQLDARWDVLAARPTVWEPIR